MLKLKQSPPVENRSTEPETSTDVPCSQAGTVQDDALLQNDTDGTKSSVDSQLHENKILLQREQILPGGHIGEEQLRPLHTSRSMSYAKYK